MTADVYLYSKAGCPACVLVKRLLNRLGVKYEERRVDENPAYRDYLVQQGFSAVPVLEIKDRGFVVGYDPSAIQNALA